MAKRICTAPDCDSPVKALGLCWKHYLRVRRTGSIAGARLSAETRFFTHVRKEPSGCWRWDRVNAKGYGQFRIWSGGKVKNYRAHCWSYEHFVGPIPEGKQLDHDCHNQDPTCLGGDTCQHRRCVNPAHLRPATGRENTLAGNTLPAANAAKTHCKRGHEFTEVNTYVTPQGNRQCRACSRDKMRRRRRQE